MKAKTISFFLLFLASCSKHPIAPPEPKISLDCVEKTVEHSGGNVEIALTANGSWSVDEIPDWMTVEPASGTASAKVVIAVRPSEQTESRDARIVFAMKSPNEAKKATLTVSQTVGKKALAWGRLMFTELEKVDFALSADGVGRTYSFTARNLLVTPAMSDKIFLGNLVNRRLGDNGDIVEYKGYTFRPITVSPNAAIAKSATFIPSLAAQQAYADPIIASKPRQSERFVFDTKGVEFGSHRELNLIGRGNMGVALDELISGKSYREREMTRKNGFVFSFSHTSFTLSMDFQEHIVEEVLNPKDFPAGTLSYISSVSYGRVGLLVVESDNSLPKVKAVIKKILQGEAPGAEERTLLNEIDAWHVCYDSSRKLSATQGKSDVIAAYKNQIENDIYQVFPFKFTVSDYFQPGDAEIGYRVFLP
ncbi:MAG: BACON domain-containing protein [Alistipes sp.]|jgi:hypothetical protein|nr:BACON domain-containing protein [Alistipes sp.]